MKELVEFIVKSMVKNPDSVEITETENEKGITLNVKISGEDFGRIIGRNGKVAMAIRTVVKTSAKKQNKFVFLKFEK